MAWRPALVLLGLGLALAGQAPTWVAAGPAAVTSTVLGVTYAGPLSALVIGPNGEIFAAGVGGIWANDRGSWTPLATGAPVSALTLAGGVLYAGTGDVDDGPYGHAGTGVLVSTNGGASWTALGGGALSGLAIARIAVDPNNAAHLLIAAMSAPDSPAGAAPGLYASIDGGASWELEIAGEVCDVAWNGAGVLAVTESGLELSSDDGADFASVPLGGPAPAGRGVAAVNPTGGFFVLWRGSAPMLLSVGESGSTPSELPLPSGLFTAGDTGLALAISGGTIWIGGAGIWESGNLGQSWTPLTNDTVVPAGQHAILPETGGAIWVVGTSGLWELPTGGTWIGFNSGLANFAPLSLVLTSSGGVAALEGDGFAAGGLDATSVWSADSAEGFAVLAADPSDPTGQSLFAVPRGTSEVGHTSDGGVQWNTAGSVPAVSGVLTALATSTQALWIGSSSGQLWISTNGGAAWMPLTAPDGAGAISALAAGGGQLWLASGANLWSSGDGGQSWTAEPAPGGYVTALAEDAVSGSWVAATDAGTELLPIAAQAWTALPVGLPAAPITTLAVDGNENLWAGLLGAGFWTLPLSENGVTLTLAPATATVTAGGSLGFQAQLESLAGPIADAAVSMTASSGTMSLWSSAPLTTNAVGTVAVTMPAPTQAGSDTLLANAEGSWGTVTATAAITVIAGAPAELEVISGGERTLTAGSVLTVVVEVADQYGNPVPKATVAFSAEAGSFSAASAITGANGQATVTYTLPMSAGTESLAASAGALTASWTETALPPPGYTLSLAAAPAPVAPNQQTTSFTVLINPVGGYDAAITLSCVPAPDCEMTSSTLNAPYPPVTVTVTLGSYAANQTSAMVTVSADEDHQLSVSIPLEGFSLTSSIGSVTLYTGGGGVTLPLAVAAINGLTGAVSLQAGMRGGGALPAGVEVAFVPNSVPLANAGVSATATLSAASDAAAPPWPPPWIGFWWLGAAALALGGWGWGWRRRPAWALAGAAALLLSATGCGSAAGAADPAPVSSTYTIELTASAAGLQVSVPVALTVITQ